MNNLDFNSIESTRYSDSVVATLMRNVYIWMTLALVITGLTAMVTAKSEALMTFIFTIHRSDDFAAGSCFLFLCTPQPHVVLYCYCSIHSL